jgi:hypothetical protein
MFAFGYFLADVATHMANINANKKTEVGRKYYPLLYKVKEKIIYPAHNKTIVKSRQKGIDGIQVTKIRSGYKVKK